MNAQIPNPPALLTEVLQKSDSTSFAMASDYLTGSLLRSLTASKPGGRCLELGTGIGASLCWMVDGLQDNSQIITLDIDPDLIAMAKNYFYQDNRVTIMCCDAEQWLQTYEGPLFDLIFADAWPGKYSHAGRALDLLKIGGFYVIDDMSPQPNWPPGHQDRVDDLVNFLDNRKDLCLTRFKWSTGVILATKIP